MLSAQCAFQFLFVSAFYEETIPKQRFLLYMPGTLIFLHAVICRNKNFPFIFCRQLSIVKFFKVCNNVFRTFVHEQHGEGHLIFQLASQSISLYVKIPRHSLFTGLSGDLTAVI